jgi:hypothetical protein
MPMTSAIAPRFSERHPRAAAIFDNLHMMHDIISDVLVADTIPHGKKRAVIYAQLDELQDSTSNVMTWEEWRNMGETMGGVAVMGGPATDLLDGVHAPITPPPGMAGMEHGAMSDGRDSAPHESHDGSAHADDGGYRYPAASHGRHRHASPDEAADGGDAGPASRAHAQDDGP